LTGKTLKIAIRQYPWSRLKTLRLHPKSIGFDHRGGFQPLPTEIKLEDLTGYRFGSSSLLGMYFHVGHSYSIEIRGQKSQLIRLKFTSLYGQNRNTAYESYRSILDYFNEHYFAHLIDAYWNVFKEVGEVKIGEVLCTMEGLKLKGKGELIPWHDVGLKDYSNHLVLFQKSHKKNHRSYGYFTSWNTGLIYSFVRAQIDK